MTTEPISDGMTTLLSRNFIDMTFISVPIKGQFSNSLPFYCFIVLFSSFDVAQKRK